MQYPRPEGDDTFDAVIVGAGPAGLFAAVRACLVGPLLRTLRGSWRTGRRAARNVR
jgi:predicted flavoprotein YhiN